MLELESIWEGDRKEKWKNGSTEFEYCMETWIDLGRNLKKI